MFGCRQSFIIKISCWMMPKSSPCSSLITLMAANSPVEIRFAWKGKEKEVNYVDLLHLLFCFVSIFLYLSRYYLLKWIENLRLMYPSREHLSTLITKQWSSACITSGIENYNNTSRGYPALLGSKLFSVPAPVPGSR
jgi:hypothetical protein